MNQPEAPSTIVILRFLAQRQLLPWLVVLMESLWLYPWVLFTSRWDALGWSDPPLSLGSAVALALAAQAASAIGLAGNWTLNTVRTMMLPALALLLLVITLFEIGSGLAFGSSGWLDHTANHVSPLLGGLGFGVLLMWRGISVGRDPTLFDGLYGRFTVGLISLVFLGILWGAVAAEGELHQVFSTIGIYALAFFATGLLALGVANLHLIRGRALRSGESFNLLDRRWLITLVGAVLVIGLLALGAVSIFSLQVVEFFTGLLGTAADALLTAFLYGIILPLTAVASILIYLFDFLFSWIGSGEPPPPPNLELFQSLEGAVDEESGRGFPRGAILALKWGLLVLGVVAAVALLAFALFRQRRASAESEDVEEFSEYFWSWQALKSDLLAILYALLGRFLGRRGARGATTSPPPAAIAPDDAPQLFSIHEIYRGLLWEGRMAGVDRRPPETPYEYQRRLTAQVGPSSLELNAITVAYVSARYGGTSIAGQRLAELNRLWRRLRASLRTPPSSTTPDAGPESG